jgi:hypothetical protein
VPGRPPPRNSTRPSRKDRPSLVRMSLGAISRIYAKTYYKTR